MNYIPNTACPDCGGNLQAMDLIDRATGEKVHEYGYSNISSLREQIPQSRFSGKGPLDFLLCVNCGRVMLVARPGSRD
jgi:hypothetical protein